MPLEYGQTDRRLTTSLMDEDMFLLRIRVERLKGNRTYSQKPKSRCHHVLQHPQVDVFDPDGQPLRRVDGDALRRDPAGPADLYAAWATHDLAVIDGALRIRAEARRPRQLRRRVRQHSVVHVTSSDETVSATLRRGGRRHGPTPVAVGVPQETAAAYGIEAGDITYAEAAAKRRCACASRYRAAGYGPGHRVGLLLENRPAFFLHWFALNALGVSIVPLNPDLRVMRTRLPDRPFRARRRSSQSHRATTH